MRISSILMIFKIEIKLSLNYYRDIHSLALYNSILIYKFMDYFVNILIVDSFLEIINIYNYILIINIIKFKKVYTIFSYFNLILNLSNTIIVISDKNSLFN